MIKAIEYRVEQLEVFNEQLMSLPDDTEGDMMRSYFENDARINELSSLADYIKGDDDNK